MGFKEDADFARFVSMGAVGTATVAQYLRTHYQHEPIELERYAMANKVWQTKVKRLRLPDLVCVRCGLRVESRAKSKLGVVLSHSEAPDRAWNAGGMRAEDLFAFLRADLSEFPPHVSEPVFFTCSALAKALDRAKRSAPKAASEGSEVTLTWPTWTPSRSGIFQGVDSTGRLVCQWNDGTVYRYWQWKRWGEPRFVYVAPGGEIIANETILAGVVAAPTDLNCPGDIWKLDEALRASDATDRYAAIKAARFTGRVDLIDSLSEIAHSKDDWRLRLEATGTLARHDPKTWTPRLITTALDPGLHDEQRIEVVFVLSELGTPEAADALETIAAATSGCPSEIRAAAAWGLGQGESQRPASLLPLATDDDLIVRLHAVVAIESLPERSVRVLRRWLQEGEPRKAATAAFLLRRHGHIEELLDACESGGTARLWAIRALGGLPEADVREVAGDRLTPDLEEALAPLWLGCDDWLEVEGTVGVEALEVQKIRFKPNEA